MGAWFLAAAQVSRRSVTSAVSRTRALQLAEHLGVAQQTLAHHEAGRLRLLAGALPTLAEQLGVSVEELIGTPTKRSTTGKRGPAPKLQQQLESLQTLPKAKQRIVSEVLDSLLAANR